MQHCDYSQSHQCENEAGLRHFIKHGEIHGCAGCCPECLNKSTCEYCCSYAKGALAQAQDKSAVFDFSALGDFAGQAAEADQQFDLHYGTAQDEYLISCIYLSKIHALTAKAGRYGGGTWTKWYESKGLSEGSARTMVKNGDAFKSATVADLKCLPELTRKDLSLIARAGCAEQLTAAAGDSQRVQELLAQLKAKDKALTAANQQKNKELEAGKKDLRDARDAIKQQPITTVVDKDEVRRQADALAHKAVQEARAQAAEANARLQQYQQAADGFLAPEQVCTQQAQMIADSLRAMYLNWFGNAIDAGSSLAQMGTPLYAVCGEIMASLEEENTIAPTAAGSEEDAEREALFE